MCFSIISFVSVIRLCNFVGKYACMKTLLQKPTKKDRELARRSVKVFEQALQSSAGNDLTEIKLQGAEEAVKVPKKAMYLFSAIISKMAAGQGVKLLDENEQLTTQEAADYLRISRPHLIKLLTKGEIPYTKVGAHRRVLLGDIEAYAQKLVENREKQLAFLARQAQELQLGYNK